ncbi:DNA breaking-rejoining enzyme [Rhodocollybia butyracea]|uniref:DNA breaking-rejoining enzyme n=1 Tax=Rhodocollybia butyracea TaxID=206335 RepID=A0A9P5Q165_9AGAR|nr:DNA breaking-rejoining enzyme [Rhodocollybia butyracea]
MKLDGTEKDPNEVRNGYNHAQKMRAAATFGFGRILSKGRTPWTVSEITGEMVRNPSVSEMVSCYMVSLRRRKVQSGEEPTSSRAITPELIGRLWDFNHQPENWEIKKYSPGRRGEKQSNEWGGPRFRRALHLAYTLSYVCLLRVDEVLKIQSHDIKVVNDETLRVTLPFRKTNQFGHIQPFYLKKLPEELKHLCPVRAYAEWVDQTHINEGFIFRKMDLRDRHAADSSKHMSSDQFLAGFRNNLLDIGVDPSPYGTHSFRRGGASGFPTDFSYMTIVKYLISWNDDPRNPREISCPLCGRTCECS